MLCLHKHLPKNTNYESKPIFKLVLTSQFSLVFYRCFQYVWLARPPFANVSLFIHRLHCIFWCLQPVLCSESPPYSCGTPHTATVVTGHLPSCGTPDTATVVTGHLPSSGTPDTATVVTGHLPSCGTSDTSTGVTGHLPSCGTPDTATEVTCNRPSCGTPDTATGVTSLAVGHFTRLQGSPHRLRDTGHGYRGHLTICGALHTATAGSLLI